MSTEQKHPADEIARALARANGILTVIGGCFDKQSGEFAIGTSYLVESISAVDGLLCAATTALGRLYHTCDLSVIRELPAEPGNASATVETLAVSGHEAKLPEPAQQFSRKTTPVRGAAKTGYLAAFGPTETATSLIERAETSVPVFKPSSNSKRETILEQPATTYDQLLAKITAVADQAAFHAQGSASDRALLPALEGLRADLLKMRAVA